MISAVDSSVVLDVVTDDPQFADASEAVLRRALTEGQLIIGESVLAEIRPAFRDTAECEEFLADWQLEFVPSSRTSALLAGDLFAVHLQRDGREGRVVADFLIGAHAQIHADRLLARDRGYLRDYFAELDLLTPAV